MKTIRVFKTINYWVDVEIEDNEDPSEAMDIAANLNEDDWDSEVIDDGYLEDTE